VILVCSKIRPPIAHEKENMVVYKIDVPANRYDLLCAEGVARAIRCYLGLAEPTTYTLLNQEKPKEKITVRPSTKQIRPFVVCGILRGVTFTPESYNSFISLQDKLHATLCRQRKLVAIGTHDYDSIKGPFIYEAKAPKDIVFKALNQQKEMNAAELMTLYESDLKLGQYLALIRDSPVYPVIYDSNGIVLSLPPIINGDHSKISLKTKNVFIECTALDYTKAVLTLTEVICMFSQYATPAYSAEAVEVVYEGGKSDVFPKLQTRDVDVDIDYTRKLIGVSELTTEKCVQLLKKMDLKGQVVSDKIFKAIVPASRGDILHSCDVAEDISVAIGFNNIKPELPDVAGCIGKQLPINKLVYELRKACTCAKYSECLTLCLISKLENFKYMRKEMPGKNAGVCVTLSNPISKDCDIARTSLLSGLLKCLQSNVDAKLPIRFFEIGDVVLLDKSTETGARNAKRLAALYCNKSAGLEYIHGLLDCLMTKLGIPFNSDKASYYLRPGKGILCFNNTTNRLFFLRECTIGDYA